MVLWQAIDEGCTSVVVIDPKPDPRPSGLSVAARGPSLRGYAPVTTRHTATKWATLATTTNTWNISW